MIKELFSVLILSLLGASWNLTPTSYSDDLTIENHALVEVNDKSALDVRIYKEREVTSISKNAFNGCSFIQIMISSTVKTVEAVYEYACDEGFLNYWKEFIRPNIDGSICNVEKANYLKMKQLYRSLDNTYEDSDLERVNKTEDGSGTIKDSVAFLDDYFSNSQKSQNVEKEISQSVMITLILIIASFGMTSIGLFYFLKDKNVIK